MVDTTEQKVSKYNAGLLQMERIHELFRAVNIASLRPTHKDENGMFGYEVVYDSLIQLFMEGSGKLKVEDVNKFIVAKDYIHNFTLTNLIIKEIPKQRGGTVGYIPTTNWLKLKAMLFDFQMLVRGLLEKVGLNSPEKGEEALI